MSSDKSKVHGLLGAMVEPDWPALTLDEVDRLLKRYPRCRGAVRLLSHSPRPFAAGAVVETPLGRVFVKRHHRSVRDREGLLEEHRFLNFLAAARASETNLVLAPLADAEGETAVVRDQWTYEVHPAMNGHDVYVNALSWTPFMTTGHALSAGRAMAKLHQASAGYEAPPRAVRQLVSSFTIFSQSNKSGTSGPIMQMERYLDARPNLKEYAEKRHWRRSFDELLLPLYTNLEPWLRHLAPLWTHNDFHASNLAWSDVGPEARVTTVIDFGLADRTTAIHDLAIAIERNIVEWLRVTDSLCDQSTIHLDHLDALLRGYEELVNLSHEEARGLIALLPLVHCEFALSETDYFLTILHSEEKAYLAYEGYLLAHAEWFNSPLGKRLMEYLERWVEDLVRRQAGEARP